ncbi:MAG TPA: mechanosensitive ion channel family protein [Blastocatellia bacterium]|nr:mechanosensitive ion channel family protein [Blastocatellia bacterium]
MEFQLRVMKKVSLPLAISLFLLLAYGAIELFKPDLISETGSRILLAAMLIGFSIVVVRAVGYVLFDVIFLKRKGREAPALLRGLLSTVLYSIFFVLIFRNVLNQGLGLEFIATSTVLTVIIGLALQDTLGNFFAGLSLHVEQPFHILDAVRIGNELGKVESITWRATTLRTNNNSIIVFPNSKVAREALEVYPYNNLNRRVLRFPAPYSVPPQKVINLIREAVRAVPNVAPEKTPIVRIGDFSDSSIVYEILYWVKDYMLIHELDAKIREHIWYIYNRNDMYIPFPVRHILQDQKEQPAKSEETDYREAIESVDLFEPLTSQEKEAVVKSIVRYIYAPGEVIIRQGDPGDSMFVISRGRVEVRLPASNGHLQRVAVLEAGNCFGEMALLTGEPRNADVYALDEVEILEIRKGIIKKLLDENNELAEAFSRKIAERQAKLDQYSHETIIEPEKQRQAEKNILRRIQRFFGLK